MVSGTFDGLIPFGFGPIIPIFPDITGAIVYENNITIASEGNGPIARVTYFRSKIFNPSLLRWSPWPLCVTHFWPSEATIFFSLKLSLSLNPILFSEGAFYSKFRDCCSFRNGYTSYPSTLPKVTCF